mgnify:CR=1 FL=1
MNCNSCICKDCKLANESDKGYCRCWNCFDCSDNKNTTQYCSMKENYEKE